MERLEKGLRGLQEHRELVTVYFGDGRDFIVTMVLAVNPEFEEVVRKAEANPATRLIVKAHNIDMVPHGPHTTITLTK